MIGTHETWVYPDPDQAPAGGVDLTCLVDTVAITHGRADATEQPEASAATLDLDLAGDVLPAGVDIGALLVVTTTLGASVSTRFAGRVTDLEVGWDDAGEDTPNAGVGRLVATGALADLGRRVVGAEPFPQELDGARVARVLALAGIVLDPLTSDPGTVQVIPRDVDKQPALAVVLDTAESAGGLLWATRDGEVRYADSEHRRNQTWETALDSCDVLVTPSWRRDLEGLVNKVSLGYGPAPDQGEQPSVASLNQASIDRYGLYDYSASTELAALADAEAMANLLTTRGGAPVWVLNQLPVDMAGLDAAATQALLSLEMHDLIQLTGMPVIVAGVPTSAYLWVEGWSETLAWGSHQLALNVSGYCRTAPPPRWNDVIDTWTWDTMPATTRWDDMACFGPQPSQGLWDDISASLRWDSVPATVTWDTWENQ